MEHRFEKEVAGSKLMVAVALHHVLELREVRATLSELGATNIYYAGKVA